MAVLIPLLRSQCHHSIRGTIFIDFAGRVLFWRFLLFHVVSNASLLCKRVMRVDVKTEPVKTSRLVYLRFYEWQSSFLHNFFDQSLGSRSERPRDSLIHTMFWLRLSLFVIHPVSCWVCCVLHLHKSLYALADALSHPSRKPVVMPFYLFVQRKRKLVVAFPPILSASIVH